MELLADVVAFQNDFNARYILVPQRNVAPGELEPLMRPFRWWMGGHRFADFEQVLRAAIVPLSLVIEGRLSTDKAGCRDLLEAVQFLQQYQAGMLAVSPTTDPLESLWLAARYAQKHWSPSFRESVPEALQSFEDGWKGILKDEVLACDDPTLLEALQEGSAAIRQTKNTTYNVIRACGNRHLEYLAEELPKLLIPADQIYFLHGLDAFPNDVEVIAFLKTYAEETKHDHVREKALEYAKRVKEGREMTGFEG